MSSRHPAHARLAALTLSAVASVAWLAPAGAAQVPGTVLDHQKIGNSQGGFGGTILSGEQFGTSATRIGDLDGDGVVDVAVGQFRNNDAVGNNGTGSVWILHLNADGTVKATTEIGDGLGGFTGALAEGDKFGHGLGDLGDLDGDGIPDLAVGADNDDEGGSDAGAVWILFLNADGSVKGHARISDASGMGGALKSNDNFGSDISPLGDLDGDGVMDIAVGASSDFDGAPFTGAVWILLLNADGTVKARSKIGSGSGGLATTDVAQSDRFGFAVENIGDLDGDGVVDLAVGGISMDEPSGGSVGGVWILFLNADGTVRTHTRITENVGGFTWNLDNFDNFGGSLAAMGDVDGDGVTELLVSAALDDDGGTNRGALYLLRLKTDGTLNGASKLPGFAAGLGTAVTASDHFGSGLSCLGDIDGDCQADFIVGANADGNGYAYVVRFAGARFKRIPAGVAGTVGLPVLTATGDLQGGDPVSLALTDARPSAIAFLIGSRAAALTPLNGGTLVPDANPPANIVLLVTDAAGSIVIPATWPAGLPLGEKIYLQSWIQDPVAPFGWAGTDGLLIIQP